jgi:hypothetical protein
VARGLWRLGDRGEEAWDTAREAAGAESLHCCCSASPPEEAASEREGKEWCGRADYVGLNTDSPLDRNAPEACVQTLP